MMVDGTDDGADGSGRPSSAVLRPELPSSPSAPVSFVVPRRPTSNVLNLHRVFTRRRRHS